MGQVGEERQNSPSTMERSFVREDDELGVSGQPGGALGTLRESH